MFRLGAVVLMLLVMTAVAVLAGSPAEAQPAGDAAYSITNPKMLDYYQHRGGARVLGQPISREFRLLGSRVQIFQYTALREGPDGAVGPLDLLSEGFLDYTHIAGLTLPAPDPEVVGSAPSIAEPDYAEKALAFVRAHAPDTWEGMPTNFFATFATTVTYQDAFPQGDAPEGLVPLLNLEMWGLPTSKPDRDPRNGEFAYLRFQRGILHFDRAAGEARWLPVGEYLKALLTGRDLPGDLAEQAAGARLYRQYDNGMPNGVARPVALPDTDMFAAFEADGIVVPTPMPTATPTATPVPPTVTPTPAATPTMTRPESIEVKGSEWFVAQTGYALEMIPDIRDFVYRIDEVSDRSWFDIPGRTLYVLEVDAFTPSWRENRDVQIQWYAGWIIHSVVHAEQYWSGRPTTGLEAEREAWLRQKDFLINHDSSEGQTTRRLSNVINQGTLDFGEWARP